MTDKTTDTLTQLYAQASAAQAPEAPPAISVAILQAAVQAAAERALLTAAAATIASPALVPATASALRRYLSHILARLLQLKSTLLSAFALPTLRYGLPAMMVAAVGFKIALPEPPHPIDTAASSASPSVAFGAAPVPPVVLDKPAPDAKSTVARRPQATATAPTIASNSPPSAAKSEAVLSETLLSETPRKDASSTQKNNALGASPASTDALPSAARPPLAQAPQAFPVNEVAIAATSNSAVFGSSGLGFNNGKPASNSSPTPASALATLSEKAKHADPLPTPTPALTPAPAPVAASMPAPTPQPAVPAVAAAPTASALRMAARANGERSSDIPKELRLRGLIASSRMVNGVVEESCNPQPPDLERVRAWLASGASPAYVPLVPNAVSTLALASRCGFDAAAQLMQSKP